MKTHTLTRELFIGLGIYAGAAVLSALIAWYGFGYALAHAAI